MPGSGGNRNYCGFSMVSEPYLRAGASSLLAPFAQEEQPGENLNVYDNNLS